MSDPKTASTTTATTMAAAKAAGPVPDGAPVAANAATTWRAIAAALRPILGGRGVDALYWRSLHLAAAAEPWLAEGIDSTEAAMDLDALATALAGQPPDRAEAGCRAVLEQFTQLLVSLVGASLTARLLASVPAPCAATPNSQDTPR